MIISEKKKKKEQIFVYDNNKINYLLYFEIFNEKNNESLINYKDL